MPLDCLWSCFLVACDLSSENNVVVLQGPCTRRWTPETCLSGPSIGQRSARVGEVLFSNATIPVEGKSMLLHTAATFARSTVCLSQLSSRATIRPRQPRTNSRTLSWPRSFFAGTGSVLWCTRSPSCSPSVVRLRVARPQPTRARLPSPLVTSCRHPRSLFSRKQDVHDAARSLSANTLRDRQPR